MLQYNVGLDRKLSLLLGGVIQIMFVIGMSFDNPHLSPFANALVGSFYPTFFSDRFGRRKPMMWGSFGLFFSMMMISILLSFKGIYRAPCRSYDSFDVLTGHSLQEHLSKSQRHRPPSPFSFSSCSSSAPRSTASPGCTVRRFSLCTSALKGE